MLPPNYDRRLTLAQAVIDAVTDNFGGELVTTYGVLPSILDTPEDNQVLTISLSRHGTQMRYNNSFDFTLRFTYTQVDGPLVSSPPTYPFLGRRWEGGIANCRNGLSPLGQAGVALALTRALGAYYQPEGEVIFSPMPDPERTVGPYAEVDEVLLLGLRALLNDARHVNAEYHLSVVLHPQRKDGFRVWIKIADHGRFMVLPLPEPS